MASSLRLAASRLRQSPSAGPAWPAQERDDEVWAVVAFLQELPTLDAADYRALARGKTGANETGAAIEELTAAEEVPQRVTESCARCHGVQGLGQGLAEFPRLAGQSAAYLAAALNAFAAGNRHSGMKEPIAAGLDRTEVTALSQYYANLEPSMYEAGPDESSPSVKRGAEIALYGIPLERVPACVDCHGPREGPQNPLCWRANTPNTWSCSSSCSRNGTAVARSTPI